MNILTTEYTLKHRAFEIYVAGCNPPHCKGCHNPQSWDFNCGIYWKDKYIDIKNKITRNKHLVKRVWILGGEPLDQDHNQLFELINKLKELDVEIWLWTRYEIDDVPEKIKQLCDYIKTGRYIPERISDDNVQFNVKLATSNQKIHKIT